MGRRLAFGQDRLRGRRGWRHKSAVWRRWRRRWRRRPAGRVKCSASLQAGVGVKAVAWPVGVVARHCRRHVGYWLSSLSVAAAATLCGAASRSLGVIVIAVVTGGHHTVMSRRFVGAHHVNRASAGVDADVIPEAIIWQPASGVSVWRLSEFIHC
jgi:hypothetical protein